MDINFTKKDLCFESDGIKCAASFYFPKDTKVKIPCVVMGHGFTGTQELINPYAEKFAKVGLAVLTFDYRYFGKSEGEPRQIVSLKKQMEDWRAVLRFARGLEGVDTDKIAIWGSSLSGGYVINLAAEDDRIAAVIAQVPAIDKSTEGMSAEAEAKISRLGLTKIQIARMYAKVILAAIYDTLRGVLGLKPYYIPVFGKSSEIAAFTDPNDYKTLEQFMMNAPTWQNKFAPRFMFDLPKYRLGTAERIKAALLICAAEHDAEANPKLAEQIAKVAPHGEFRLYPGGHFEAYYGDIFERMVKDETEFLQRHLL